MEDVLAPEKEAEKRARPIVTRAPGVPVGPTVAEGSVDELGEDLTGEPVDAAFHDAPIPAFIDELFGERLGMSYHIAPELREKTDLVSLRVTERLPPAQVFAMARRILEEDYGVRIRAEDDGTLSFIATDEIGAGGIPLVVTGRALPEVPASHRIIFQIVPLKVLRPNQLVGLVKALVAGQDLTVQEEPTFNALLLRGKRNIVERAVAMIEVLDQPLLSGRNGIIIEPAFLGAAQMADDLLRILQAQGYQASIGAESTGTAVILLPLPSANKLAVFAADPAILERIEEWAEVVDAQQQAAVEDGLFSYEFRNTLAEDLIDILNQVIAGIETETTQEEGTPAPRSRRADGGLVYIPNTNTVLYRGSGQDWAKIRAFIDKLDRPVPQVLIEVLIAEVTLTGREESGVEYLFNVGVGGSRDADVQLTPAGVSLTLDSAGKTRALLRLAYEDNRVAIRSRPWLVVKSGESASIFGGAQIPLLSQRAEGPQVEGSASIVQEITYSNTGVTLNITPIVQANGLVDVTINQQLSENRAAGAASLTPTILTRNIDTSLTLRDGQSLLMGGLISDSQTEGRSGIPGLGQVPVLGRLFRTDSYQNDRTELVVMVIPYVIAEHGQGHELTEQIKAQLELHRRFL